MPYAFYALLFSLVGVLLPSHLAAQSQVFRCGNEYLNDARDAKARGCKLLEGGNVTVVQGTSVKKGTNRSPANPPAAGVPTTSPSEQRARDSDARAIVEAELTKAQAKLAELQKEYNQGEPEKQGIEGRNYQRYLDRVNELKEALVRSESDVAGLKRELARLPASPTPAQP